MSNTKGEEGRDNDLERRVSKDELLERDGLVECSDRWLHKAGRFTGTLRNQKAIRP